MARRQVIFDAEGVRALVRDRVRSVGGATAYGARIGVCRQYVDDVSHGRRGPGPGFLSDLGLVRAPVTYVRVHAHGEQR